MNTLRCPFCDADLARREAADGWCETCGKQLPSGIVDQASVRRAPAAAGAARGGSGPGDTIPGRLAGVLMLGLGALFVYLCIYSPLAAVARLEPKVSLSLTGNLFIPLCLVDGVVFTVFGQRAAPILGTSRTPTPLGLLCGFALVAVGGGVYLVMKAVLVSAGYSF